MGFLVEPYRLFLIALQRYGCIHAPLWVNESSADARAAIRYFPLVGLLTGLFSGIVYITVAHWLPPAVAVVIAILSGQFFTRAVHERGLSTTANDWFAGAPDFSAGTVAVCMVLLLKFSALAYLQNEWIVFALICGHAFSRLAALPLVVVWDKDSLLQAQAEQPCIGPGEFLTAAFYGLLPLVLMVTNRHLEPQMRGPLLIGAGAALAVAALLGFVMYRRSMQMSDAKLSAIQQGAEVVFYLGLLISPH